MVPEGLDARLSLQHEGRIIASQKAPPSPASLRSRNGTSPAATIPTHDPELASKPLVTTLDLTAQTQIKKMLALQQSTIRT